MLGKLNCGYKGSAILHKMTGMVEWIAGEIWILNKPEILTVVAKNCSLLKKVNAK